MFGFCRRVGLSYNLTRLQNDREWASWRTVKAPAIVDELAGTPFGEDLLETNRRPCVPSSLGTTRQK
jgi:hypothetical protein